MKRRTELSDTEQETHDDAKADANAAAALRERYLERLTNAGTMLDVLKSNNELRCYVAELLAWAVEDTPTRAAHIIEVANKIEREVSRG